MYSITDLKKGTYIQISAKPYQVLDYQHVKVGRGGAVAKTQLRSLSDGGVINRTFKGNEKIQPAQVDKVDLQYQYRTGKDAFLMNMTSFEQYQINVDKIGGPELTILPFGAQVVALLFNGQVVGIELPHKVKVLVKSTEPAVKGNTANTALKPAELDTGAIVQVPLFIKPGDSIIIDSRTSAYVERAK